MAQIADGSGQYVTIREARDILGLREWSMRKLLEDTKTPVARLPLDRRGHWLKRSDVEKLRQTLYQPVTTATQAAG